jgi:type IV fimbrial biogenesis protein FimT
MQSPIHPVSHQGSRRQLGVTAVESMCVLAIIGILAGVTMPDVQPLRQRAELLGLASQVETDVHLARSEAVSRNRTVRFTLQHSAAGGSCYQLHEGVAPVCTCEDIEAGRCSDARVFRALALPSGSPVQVQGNVRSMAFDPLKGTVTPTGTLRVVTRDGQALHQVVGLLGRVRTCSPGGTPALGAPAC